MEARSTILLACLLASTPSLAQWNEHPPLDVRDRLTFSATAETTIQNDLMTALLSIEASGATLAEAANEANEIADWAFDTVDGFETVTARTANYQTWERRAQRDAPTEFGVNQQLLVTSNDDAELTTLLGVLQARAKIQSVGYGPSREQREATEAKMVDAALRKFRAEAERHRATLGYSGYEIVVLQVSSHTVDPADAARNRQLRGAVEVLATGSSVTAPRLKGGTSTVTGTASGIVQLLP
ncbi:MAG: SIMPL domain-containing protein [Myxococcota bacterium]|nr:SIMPL domain-containing protein [Myxococcota bacterium]